MWRVEHWSNVPISLWGFHVSELALKNLNCWFEKAVVVSNTDGNYLSHPLNCLWRYLELINNPPPQAAYKIKQKCLFLGSTFFDWWAVKGPILYVMLMEKGLRIKLTSMWSQMPYFSQMSAMGSIGSKAPYTVVPVVQLTKKGKWPSDLWRMINFSNSSGIIRPLCN